MRSKADRKKWREAAVTKGIESMKDEFLAILEREKTPEELEELSSKWEDEDSQLKRAVSKRIQEKLESGDYKVVKLR